MDERDQAGIPSETPIDPITDYRQRIQRFGAKMSESQRVALETYANSYVQFVTGKEGDFQTIAQAFVNLIDQHGINPLVVLAVQILDDRLGTMTRKPHFNQKIPANLFRKLKIV